MILCLIIDVDLAVLFSIFLLELHSLRLDFLAQLLSSFSVVFHKVYPRASLLANCESTVHIYWTADIKFKPFCYSSWAFPPSALGDEVTEADEMYQNAGEKGILHDDPDDPPRRRANKARGHGTWDNDRPPIAGVVGRESGQIRLEVCHNSDRATLQEIVENTTKPGATVNTDEWGAYNSIPETGRIHKTVCHTPGKREWARDDDGDGIREVHSNTMEGIWTGLRNFLRIFRGVSKHYLNQYVGLFQWSHNSKVATLDFLRAMVGVVVSHL